MHYLILFLKTNILQGTYSSYDLRELQGRYEFNQYCYKILRVRLCLWRKESRIEGETQWERKAYQ